MQCGSAKFSDFFIFVTHLLQLGVDPKQILAQPPIRASKFSDVCPAVITPSWLSALVTRHSAFVAHFWTARCVSFDCQGPYHLNSSSNAIKVKVDSPSKPNPSLPFPSHHSSSSDLDLCVHCSSCGTDVSGNLCRLYEAAA